MEQQTISVAKAGITTVLNSRTAVLAAATRLAREDDVWMQARAHADALRTMRTMTIGAAFAPGKFAHLMVYRDFEGLMKAQQNLSEGGWRDRQDYYASYANCNGESVRTETIMRRPSS